MHDQLREWSLFIGGGCDEIRKIMEFFHTPPSASVNFSYPPPSEVEIISYSPSAVVNISYPPEMVKFLCTPSGMENTLYSQLVILKTLQTDSLIYILLLQVNPFIYGVFKSSIYSRNRERRIINYIYIY